MIYGEIPSKKNSKRWIFRGNKKFLVPSLNHEKWHQEIISSLKKREIPLIKNIKSVKIEIFPKTKRKADLTNKAESIMDILVDSNIIIDDNWFEIPEVTLRLGDISPDKPRAYIEIQSSNDTD